MNKQELEELFKRKIEHYQEMLQGEHDDLADCTKIYIKALYNKTFDVIHHLEDELERYYSRKIDSIQKKLAVGFVDRNKKYAYFAEAVGTGTRKSEDGNELEFELLLSATNGSPIIRYENNYYVLTWEDILKLAENAGLFEESDK